MKVGLKFSNAWYINYMRICYELTVRNDLRTYHYFSRAFSKKTSTCRVFLWKKKRKKKSRRKSVNLCLQVFCCSLFIEKPRVADAISSVASILAISLATLSQKLKLAVEQKDVLFFFKVGLTLNIMIFKCFFFSKSFFVVFFTSSPKKSPRFLLRDHQWLGYISGCFPFMNVFQALASMLYLSAAVECDDAGCKDVGATRSKCFS